MSRTKRYFITGLTVFLPVLLTVYLMVLIFNFTDNFLGKFIKPFFYWLDVEYIRGLSILIFIALIILLGFLFTHFLGRRLYPIIERQLLKLPFFRQVYPTMKEIAIFLFSREKPTFKQVVLVQYPRKGVYAVGFLVNDSSKELCAKTGQDLCNVFIPTSPTPLSGFVSLIPREEIITTDITIEQAFKFFASDGVVNPI